MPVYKDDKKWYFRCYKDGKQYHSKKYESKSEALEAERIFMLEKKNPIRKNFHLVAMSYFEDAKKTIKSSTIQSYEYDYNKHLKPYFEKFSVGSINNQVIAKWHSYMDKKELSVDFKNKVNSVLCNILNYAVRNYNLDKNVALIYGRFIEKKESIPEEKVKYITLEQFNNFLSVVDDDMYKLLFMFLFYTGCRKSEAFCLNWNDFDETNGIITINKTLTRTDITSNKTNQIRKVKLNKTLLNELIVYKNKKKNQYNNFSNKWFIFGDGYPISRTSVDRYKDKYIELSNSPYFTCHTLRHSAVTLLVNEMMKQDNNMSVDRILFILSTRFGHSPDVMIRTYAHLWEDRLQDNVVNILDNL